MKFDNITLQPLYPLTGSDSQGPSIWTALVVGLILAASVNFIWNSLFDAQKPPFAGFRSFWEPAFLVRLRFSWGAKDMIRQGYEKYTNSLYRLARNDRNVVVIPNRYVDELRALPQEKLSSIQALIANLAGKWSYSDLLLESDLHTRILQTKVTPNLPNLVDAMNEELQYSLRREVPKCDDHWESVEIYEMLLHIIARISARVFVGESLARNDDWLKASIGYADQATVTTMLLRAVPKSLHPVVVWFLPPFWRTRHWVRRGQDLLVPLIHARRAAEAKGDPAYQKPSDFLQWMMDGADANEGIPEKLALRELIMGLASVHTTTMAIAHALYDLCEHPEYLEPLRDELRTVLQEDGGWKKITVHKLRKMDSFLKESQRLSPASLLGFHRIVQNKPITLADGIQLAPGTHICCASYEVSKDPAIIPDQAFDGFRYYELRKNPDEDKKLQYAMTDRNHMHFGHGRYACPGRFFAANEIKMILGELLLDYDFRFLDGQGRPVNHNADEFLYPNPATRLLMKRRLRM